MYITQRKLILLCLLGLITFKTIAQRDPKNYIATEAQVPAYTLPSLFPASFTQLSDLQKRTEWENKVKPSYLKAFEESVYGESPKSGYTQTLTLVEQGKTDSYLRKQYRLAISFGTDTNYWEVLVLLPLKSKPKGLFLGLNFYGNHTIISDEKIRISESYRDNNPAYLINNNKANALSRGIRNQRWPVLNLIREGFGLVTCCYQDIEPDSKWLPPTIKPYGLKKLSGKNEQWGAVGAWAFGLSRIAHGLSAEKSIGKHIPWCVVGHSRNGKAALWAAAQDTIFKAVLANGSGRAGASLFRRDFGETIQEITNNFPYWFVPALKKYIGKEDSLPTDQHQLIALVAPRKAMIASGSNDWWADPKGEFLSLYHAGEAWQLYGISPLNSKEPPKANMFTASAGQAYHLRNGDHDITYLEWQRFLEWVKK